MPRRRVTIAALMTLVLFAGLVIALLRGEVENHRLRAELATERARAELNRFEVILVDQLRDASAGQGNASPR